MYRLRAVAICVVLAGASKVMISAGKGDAAHSLERYRGLSSRRPGLALIFTVLLMAQTGVPFGEVSLVRLIIHTPLLFHPG